MDATLLIAVGIAVYAALFYPVWRLVRRMKREAHRTGYTQGWFDAMAEFEPYTENDARVAGFAPDLYRKRAT